MVARELFSNKLFFFNGRGIQGKIVFRVSKNIRQNCLMGDSIFQQLVFVVTWDRNFMKDRENRFSDSMITYAVAF